MQGIVVEGVDINSFAWLDLHLLHRNFKSAREALVCIETNHKLLLVQVLLLSHDCYDAPNYDVCCEKLLTSSHSFQEHTFYTTLTIIFIWKGVCCQECLSCTYGASWHCFHFGVGVLLFDNHHYFHIKTSLRLTRCLLGTCHLVIVIEIQFNLWWSSAFTN